MRRNLCGSSAARRLILSNEERGAIGRAGRNERRTSRLLNSCGRSRTLISAHADHFCFGLNTRHIAASHQVTRRADAVEKVIVLVVIGLIGRGVSSQSWLVRSPDLVDLSRGKRDLGCDGRPELTIHCRNAAHDLPPTKLRRPARPWLHILFSRLKNFIAMLFPTRRS